MITYEVYSDVGSRERNEDSAIALELKGNYCFIVADGLGGHGGGEYASAIAAETVRELFMRSESDGDDDSAFLDKCFVSAQENVTKQQKTDVRMADMKTTMVILDIRGGVARWGHIGDSRLYSFCGKKILARTLDHSVPQMLVNMGEIKEKDIRGHEDRNRLLRVIGSPWGRRSYDLAEPVELRKTDAFLLCTDGFWELIDEKKMIALLRKSDNVSDWMQRMVEVVRQNGKEKNMDNNTAIAVWVTEEQSVG